MQTVPPLAEQLARHCVLLTRSGEKFAAVWGGPGVAPVPEGPYKHWISIDCRYLPAEARMRAGVLSVYSNEQDLESGVVVHTADVALTAQDGEPLYAHGAQSLPPPDADPSLDTAEYMSTWQASCPIYTDNAVAVLGGWHFPWPDGDWERLQSQTFLLLTIENSEPWVEAWYGPSGFNVIQRIT